MLTKFPIGTAAKVQGVVSSGNFGPQHVVSPWTSGSWAANGTIGIGVLPSSQKSLLNCPVVVSGCTNSIEFSFRASAKAKHR